MCWEGPVQGCQQCFPAAALDHAPPPPPPPRATAVHPGSAFDQ